MTLAVWSDTDRKTLSTLLPDALVVLPLGSVEQHGPHLPTGTDTIIAGEVASQAVEQAHSAARRPLVLAPVLTFGASDHHLPFGGTLSLSAPTLLAALTDILTSMTGAAAKRIVLVNGHGGNTGACHQAAAAVSSRSESAIAHVDYWNLIDRTNAGFPVPGHAGQFETAMIRALRPGLVHEPERRPDGPEPAPDSAVETHRAASWAAIDGFTDHPERADAATGTNLLAGVVDALASRFIGLAEEL